MSNEVDVEDFLAHFGVKGMKWGVIRDREALGRAAAKAKETVSEKSSAVAKDISNRRTAARAAGVKDLRGRAEFFDRHIKEMDADIRSLRKERQSLTLPKQLANSYKTVGLKDQKARFETERNRLLKDAEAKEKGKLTSTQKKLLVGAAFVGVALIGVGLYQANESGALNSSILRGKAFLNGSDSPFIKNSALARKDVDADFLKKVIAGPVNPNYKNPGGAMNCRRSTFAYELRRRGYDVHATPAIMGTGQSESGLINALTPGKRNLISPLSVTKSIQTNEINENPLFRTSGGTARDRRENPLGKNILRGLRGEGEYKTEDGASFFGPQSNSKSVLEELAKQGNGARGEVLFNFGAFGHSMAYEVVNGKALIIDSQKAKVYDEKTRVESKWDGFHSAEITRLDNANLDLSFLSRWATNLASPTAVAPAAAPAGV